MRGTLDLSSHRLDAWVTSFATKRLNTMRHKDPAGVYLGGYGWVEDLQPGPPRTEVTAPPGEPGPIFGFRNDPGFVHAPSLDHAATVAVLRSGHLTRFGRSPDPQADPLAIDLLPNVPARRSICWMGCDPASRSPHYWGIASSAPCTSAGWTSSSMRSASSRRSSPHASTEPGNRSSPCQRTMWWMGSSSCGKAERRRIALRCSCSPAIWREFRLGSAGKPLRHVAGRLRGRGSRGRVADRSARPARRRAASASSPAATWRTSPRSPRHATSCCAARAGTSKRTGCRARRALRVIVGDEVHVSVIGALRHAGHRIAAGRPRRRRRSGTDASRRRWPRALGRRATVRRSSARRPAT